ncbi:DUF4083 domain-containing protein [Oceanobacillus chungangensis]|uniref:DUF4083 domain-containing protein n=1 Tax=Oceanobacillus chungangensis TaxID=1229152 RepID=A0A3D8PGB2_9BACI|nr:DUF4083 domain-containing protein [Oceanobacillus chungangensis]RDW15130.1 DUF4083 domain-containing protein [Oceanobacillus chungangensis]
MDSFRIGDAIFQLLNLGFLLLIIVLIVSFFRSYIKRRNQLDSLEKKIDDINEQIKKGNN